MVLRQGCIVCRVWGVLSDILAKQVVVLTLGCDHNNAFYRHQNDTQKYGSMHNFDWNGAELLCREPNWYNRLVLESSLIKTSPNFNGMKSTLGIDHFSAKLVINSVPKLKSKIG